CGGGTDTIKQVVVINQPCISVSSTSITCANLGSATVQATGGIGPYSYTWMPTGQTNSVATGLSPGVYTLTVFDFGNNFTYTAMATFNSLIPLSGMQANSPSVNCNGAATGTAAVTGITGGSGSQNYLWTNGVTSYTAPNPTNLTAGNYTFTVTDALTGCMINGGFFISQPPALTLNIAAGSPSTCAGTGVTFTGTAYGGLPYTVGSPYTYSWTGGPANFSYTPVQAVAGNYIYTLTARDSKSCQVVQTESLSVIPNPTLNVTSVQICPLQTATLNAFGATSYTWNGLYTGSSYADNPLSTTVYTLTGAAQGCSATAKTATIILKTVPVPTLTTNSPRCNAASLLLNGSGGSTYNWSGPLLFTSALQNPTINPVGLTNAGVYNLTVTAANGCTASTSANVVINPTPTLSAFGSTVCVGNPASLSANSVAGATYFWSGPLSYTSNVRNSILPGATGGMTGSYTVLATSVSGCTNTASVSLVVVPSPSPGITLSTYSVCAQALSGSSNFLIAAFNGGSTYTLTAPAYISVSNPGGPTSALTVAAPFTPGPVNVNLNASNGVCSVSTTAVFTIIPNPVITVSPLSAIICQGRTFTFNATGASSYAWSPAQAGILSYSAGAMVIVSPSLSTLFSVYGSSVGCNSAQQNANLTVNPLPVIIPEPLSATICLYNRTPLKVNGTATSHTWSPATGLNTTFGSSVIAGPLASQDYTILGSLNSCTSTAVMSVFVLPLPVPSLSLSSTAVCLNQTITAQGFGGLDYLWTDPIGFTRLGQTTSFLINNAGYAGTHTLLVTDQNGCKAMRTFVISVYDLPTGILSGSQMQGCVPFCSDFSFYSPSQLSVLWQVDGKNTTGNTFSHCFNQVGQYHITGNLQDTITGCVNVQDFVVNGWPRPVAGFEYYPISPIESLDEVIFTNTSKGDWQTKWHWYFISNAGSQSDHQNTYYTFGQAGVYPVAMVVSNQMGCSDTITKVITVEQDFNIYVPNAFTPNEDGLNELFRPVLRGAKSFHLSVYNRWGQKLYETSDFNSGWDGKYKGQPCKQEVYIWKLNVKAINNDSSKTG
ncbi:MAG: gliding motility-associated C-terminal domain-containing protein, partial [Bacteroidota bacterium]